MKKSYLLSLIVLLVFCGCTNRASLAEWGSFTSEKAFSYDSKYYAVQKTTEKDDTTYINVEIYTSEDVLVDSFQPARARDFWGICWEKDTYNIWIQSGDIGILCYSCDNEEWSRNNTAIRPEYIVSKYDDIT